MNREEFFGRLAGLDEERLRKMLWNLYWRGTSVVRERIEDELEPAGDERAKRPRGRETVDPQTVLREIREFAQLARSGAYIGGDRRVSPKERARWRFTFQRLVADARAALGSDDPQAAFTAMEELIELASETRTYDYFHSDDAMEAAKFVLSDAAELLWSRIFEIDGFPAFVARAAPQLVRWESRYGWTRRGFGQSAGLESSLATVIARMLRTGDSWVVFADRYLEALDEVARLQAAKPTRSWEAFDRRPDTRAANLATWHELLFERLFDTEAEDRLDRLVRHGALAGPELLFVQAKLAHRRGNADQAQKLMREALEKLPGHQGFLEFAVEIGAPLPDHARRLVAERIPPKQG